MMGSQIFDVALNFTSVCVTEGFTIEGGVEVGGDIASVAVDELGASHIYMLVDQDKGGVACLQELDGHAKAREACTDDQNLNICP
ncbi:hypothetical protein GOP47_0017998 [Adiantum capillus-veneris]|uniref:Uncharacterized protein n=1 Tax=Adiantum capillus-veneris TaxID=13818 RepID=A0A9D4UGQ0_ADICA|nr:hypothetical protein GOP47_0017998 [Adiantum capillus-veneris]